MKSYRLARGKFSHTVNGQTARVAVGTVVSLTDSQAKAFSDIFELVDTPLPVTPESTAPAGANESIPKDEPAPTVTNPVVPVDTKSGNIAGANESIPKDEPAPTVTNPVLPPDVKKGQIDGANEPTPKSEPAPTVTNPVKSAK